MSLVTHLRSGYTQPTAENVFPFLLVEIKSEAKKGTIWHAENQAAGGGAHCVNSIRWLLHEAEGSSTPEVDPTKTLAFSICLTARQALLYVHSYSPKNQQFLMSFVQSYIPTRPVDIQECNRHVKNISDFALNIRRLEIDNSLDALHPPPDSWPSKKRVHSTASSTPATFFSIPQVDKT